MDYYTFKNMAIHARGIYKTMRDYDADRGDELSRLVRQISCGYDVIHSMLFLWVCRPEHDIYKWTIEELYDAVAGYAAFYQIYPGGCFWMLRKK